MQCFAPITAWKLVDGGISFVERGKNLDREVQIRCGRCIGCRLSRANAWAVRCVHEAKMHPFNSFVTLTYDDDHYPQNGSLDYRDFQLFAKRYRKKFGAFRFYMCGEYGEQLSRPHFHALMFGVDFPDRVRLSSVYSKKHLYRSAALDSLWGKGFASIGEVNMSSAQYVAQYCVKKIYGDLANDHYKRVVVATGEIVEVTPEFSRMSLKPGIGASWFAKYGNDVAQWDNIVINGSTHPVPKYYDKIMEVQHSARKEELDFLRYEKADAQREDNTLARLAVKEECAQARVKFYSKRTYEN